MTASPQFELLEAPGRYFDGQTARGRDVVVKFGDASLMILNHDDLPVTHWSLSGLSDLAAGDAVMTLAPDHDSDERLTVDDPTMIEAIRAVCPNLDARRPVSKSRMKAVAFWAVAALVSVYLIGFHLVPALSDQLARLIPAEAEAALGETMTEQFARVLGENGEAPEFCTSPAGDAALAALFRRLGAEAAVDVPLTIRVLDHKMVNAFALPGGQILIFKGLLREAESPEEVAGVLAHELGHVEKRDPTRLTLRSAGTAGLLGILLGDFTGATVTVALSEALLRSGYRREAEAVADEFAARLLSDRGLPTPPVAAFFRRLKSKNGGGNSILSHIATHPDLEDRARRIEAADTIGDGAFEPALTDQDWVALRNICR